MTTKELFEQCFEAGKVYGADLEFGSYPIDDFEQWYDKVGKQLFENISVPGKHRFIDILIEEVDEKREGIFYSGNDEEIDQFIALYKAQ